MKSKKNTVYLTDCYDLSVSRQRWRRVGEGSKDEGVIHSSQ